MINHKGYTLIETMVGVAIFMLILTPAVSFFVSSLKAQQKVLFSQKLLDNISYSLEYMSRTLRMAKKDTSGNCITKNMNYELSRGGRGIKFLNYNDICQEFYWDTALNPRRLNEVKNGLTLPLTASDADVVSFKIGPTESWDQNDDEQPKVTIYLEVKGVKSPKPELQPDIKIQTTISQRNLDIQI